MTETIAPALTPEEWESLTARGTLSPHLDEIIGSRANLLAASSAATIAVANWALPDDDPRKITREDMWYLRQLRDEGIVRMGEMSEWLTGFVARVAALLPPDDDRYPRPALSSDR